MIWLICARGKEDASYHHDLLIESDERPLSRKYKAVFKRVYGLNPKLYWFNVSQIDRFPYPVT